MQGDLHEVTVTGTVTTGVGDVVCYDADQPVEILVDSMSIMPAHALDWLSKVEVSVEPGTAGVNAAIVTEAGGVVVAVFRGDDERLWCHVAIDGAGGQGVHLAELGGRRMTPIISIPDRGYVYESSTWHDDPTGEPCLVQQYTAMISEHGSWHRTTWTHLVEAAAYLCEPLGLSPQESEL